MADRFQCLMRRISGDGHKTRYEVAIQWPDESIVKQQFNFDEDGFEELMKQRTADMLTVWTRERMLLEMVAICVGKILEARAQQAPKKRLEL